MFDIGFSEMLVLGIVALVVLGPERLPRVARQVGHWLGTARRYVEEVKADWHRQVESTELRALQTQMSDAARALQSEMQQAMTGQGSVESAPASLKDWEKIAAMRRQREKILERRAERDKALGRRRPRRSAWR